MPFPENEGLTAAPGQSSSIGIKQVASHRLGGKYKQCTHLTDEQKYELNMFAARYPVGYSNQVKNTFKNKRMYYYEFYWILLFTMLIACNVGNTVICMIALEMTMLVIVRIIADFK